MTFTLPWPPSLNNAYPTGRNGRRFLSDVGKRFKQAVSVAVLAQGRPTTPLLCRLRVELEAYPPDRRRRDLDNLVKATLDGLTTAGCWADDSQIDDLRIVRRAVTHGGLVRVTMARIEPLG